MHIATSQKQRGGLAWRGVILLALAAIALTGAATKPTLPAAPDFAAYARLAGYANLIEIRVSGQKRRVEIATDALVQTFIEDREHGILTVLTGSAGRRLAYQFPLPDQGPPVPLPMDARQLSAAQRVQKIGADNVSGVPCALYRYVGYLGGNGEVCVSREGVVMRLRPDGRKEPVYQIERIVFRRQDPNLFVAPLDYTRAALPGMGGAGFGHLTAKTLANAGAHEPPPLGMDEARITYMNNGSDTDSMPAPPRDIPSAPQPLSGVMTELPPESKP